MSVFLMGVYDQSRCQWCTVAKCGNGHDDATIMKLQKELKMKRISKVTSSPTFHQQLHHKIIVPVSFGTVSCYVGFRVGV